MGGEEVDGALAPPRALHDEHPLAIVHQRSDRLALPVTEVGVGPPGEPPERIEQWVGFRDESIMTEGCRKVGAVERQATRSRTRRSPASIWARVS